MSVSTSPMNQMIPMTPMPGESQRRGRFGVYGGRYVPETLMAALLVLDAAYADGPGRMRHLHAGT